MEVHSSFIIFFQIFTTLFTIISLLFTFNIVLQLYHKQEKVLLKENDAKALFSLILMIFES
jgi:hypothetical protein